jgi:hypothetical protein
MSTYDERVAALEAIAYGDDPRISPDNRMSALDRLDRLPGHGAEGSGAMMAVAADVALLSGEALDEELAGMFNPGWQEPPPPPPPPGAEQIERHVESRVRRALRRWAKTQDRSLDPEKAAPRQVPAEPERVAAETAETAEPDKVVPLSAVEKRRLVREQKRAVQWAERMPPCPEGMDPAMWEMYADELDGV